MRQLASIPTALTIVLASGAQVTAEPSWCSQNPGAIFCFDFDRLCSNPPPYPEVCPEGSTKLMFMHNPWQYTSWNYNTQHSCGSDMTPEEIKAILPTDPYGGRHANGGDESGQLGQNTVDLGPYVRSATGGLYTVANGSDAQPLVLAFTMGAYAYHALMFNNGYLELSLGDPSQYSPVTDPAKAPTNFILVGGDNGAGCFNCNSTCGEGSASLDMVSWPTICQQEFPHPLCPPKQTFVRSALAIGALALLDNNPCHCCTQGPIDNPAKPWQRRCTAEFKNADFPDGWQEPTNIHLSYFDGLEWRVLKAGMGGPGSYGEFRYGNYKLLGVNKNTDEGYETVVFTIKSNTVDIYHRTKMVDLVEGQWIETWVESLATDLPRRYTGEFNRLRAGTDEACQLNYDSHTCSSAYANGKKKCKVMKEDMCTGGNATYRSSYVAFDNIRLTGGIGGVEIGACCLDDATCVETDLYACETVLGGHYQGAATSCSATHCCPYPFADTDIDADVDQDDFGLFQICYTGQNGGVAIGCECLNRNSKDDQDKDDGIADIDIRDLDEFSKCWSGPNVPAVPVPVGCNP